MLLTTLRRQYREMPADGLFRQRKTLAPEKGGDPPLGGEDFPCRDSQMLHQAAGAMQKTVWSFKGSEYLDMS